MQNVGGKMVGILLGLLFGGPQGAIVGLILGHLHDIKNQTLVRNLGGGNNLHYSWQAEQVERSTYAIGVIVLGAKMAKAGGHVSYTEIAAFKRVFHIHPEQDETVGRIFDQARMSAEGYEPYAMRLAQVFRRNPLVLEEIISGLFTVAAIDSQGQLSTAETRFLSRVASLFGFTPQDFARIAARSGVRLPPQETPDDERNSAYIVLGLPANASEIEIKKTYRALIRKHHPDKLVSQGMPPELISQATEKMKRINAAYDSICKARDIK